MSDLQHHIARMRADLDKSHANAFDKLYGRFCAKAYRPDDASVDAFDDILDEILELASRHNTPVDYAVMLCCLLMQCYASQSWYVMEYRDAQQMSVIGIGVATNSSGGKRYHVLHNGYNALVLSESKPMVYDQLMTTNCFHAMERVMQVTVYPSAYIFTPADDQWTKLFISEANK